MLQIQEQVVNIWVLTFKKVNIDEYNGIKIGMVLVSFGKRCVIVRFLM